MNKTKLQPEKSDVPTDAHAYEECMRIHQEEPPRALRTLCADKSITTTTVCDITSLLDGIFSALQSAGLVLSAPNAHMREPELFKLHCTCASCASCCRGRQSNTHPWRVAL